LDRAVAAGRFREDLYYRINVIQIVVPPLRERREEIPFLITYFIERHSRLFGREGFGVPSDVMEALVKHSYPGNVREVENLVKRMIVLGDPSLVTAALSTRRVDASATGTMRKSSVLMPSLKDVARQAARSAEREAIAKVLEDTRWNRVKAAKLLRISYRALLYKIKDVGLDRPRPENPSSN
jgi:two-component system, NtrC family, response regulator AtoC